MHLMLDCDGDPLLLWWGLLVMSPFKCDSSSFQNQYDPGTYSRLT